MKAVVAAFNQEKALVGAFSVIANLQMELFQALLLTRPHPARDPVSGGGKHLRQGRQLGAQGDSALFRLPLAGPSPAPARHCVELLQIMSTSPHSAAAAISCTR